MDKTVTPHYLPADLWFDLAHETQMFYLRLSNGDSSSRLLGLLKEKHYDGITYGKFLNSYPHIMCEHLESYYRWQNATAKLDKNMMHDLLLRVGNWRIANWGAWLAALSPQAEYIELLDQTRPHLPYGTDIIDLAKAACGTELPAHLTEHAKLLHDIRQLLSELPKTRLPLRLNINDEIKNQLDAEVERIRFILRTQGEQAALFEKSQCTLGYYQLNYKQWLHRGAPTLSEFFRQNHSNTALTLDNSTKNS